MVATFENSALQRRRGNNISQSHVDFHDSKELTVALKAVGAAGALCRAGQSSIDTAVLRKEDRSPVTVADFGSQAIVCRALRQAFPDDPVVAEEDATALREPAQLSILEQVTARVAAEFPEEKIDHESVCQWIDAGNAEGGHRRFWTLDPIDGTKGFLRGDQYAVALALIEDGDAQVAVLGCPNLAPAGVESGGSMLWAVRGGGAWEAPLGGPKTDSEAAEPKEVRISDAVQGSDARLTESVESRHSSHSEASQVSERLGIITEPLRLDSQVKYAVVARGEAEIYLRLLTVDTYREKIWDHAAGALIVSEAGGRVTDRRGRPLDFTAGVHLGPHEDIVATNGRLHDAVLEALANDE